jgi:hypothetical protein
MMGLAAEDVGRGRVDGNQAGAIRLLGAHGVVAPWAMPPAVGAARGRFVIGVASAIDASARVRRAQAKLDRTKPAIYAGCTRTVCTSDPDPKTRVR